MGVLRVALPETLSAPSIAALEAGLERAATDPDVRVVVLAGSAGTFCRGMEFAALAEEGADAPRWLARYAATLTRLRGLPRATLALVDGEALGGGVGLAAACDVVLATPRSTFGLPEALFGILPGMVMPVLLERMTAQKARLLALTGQARDAAWAREHGLCDEVVEAERLERTAARWARDLGRVQPPRVAGLRSWIFELGRLEAGAAVVRGATVTADLLCEPSVREAARVFREEGTPPWVSR